MTTPSVGVSVLAPSITSQPANQSVPMGLSATYSVTASGTSPQYQWQRNGAAIAGATASSYTTPATTFADAGASFSVIVTNAAGSVTSSDASLTITARAPDAGDLRFQLVDAPATVSGWANAGIGLNTMLPGRSAFSYSPSVGTPLWFGSAGYCSVPPITNGVGCDWSYAVWPVAASVEAPATIYGADFFENFPADLVQPGAWGGMPMGDGLTPTSSSSVINSLDLEPASDLFAVSWLQALPSASREPASAFVMEQNTVSPAALPAAATQEGAAGRVITAVSVSDGQITYFAYAWQADPLTIYEAQVLQSSTANAPVAAAALASQGYIITAIGQADDSGDLLLVGTRVQGDSMPRPFQTAPGGAAESAWQQQGYAIVGVIVNLTQTNPYTYLFER